MARRTAGDATRAGNSATTRLPFAPHRCPSSPRASLRRSMREVTTLARSRARVSRIAGGLNDRGQLGDGTTTTRSAPVAVTGGHIFESIASGGFEADFGHGHTCAVADGTAYCWGDNERGQLGIGSGGLGSEDLTPHPTPMAISGFFFNAITAGLGRHTCGLTNSGAAYCWGREYIWCIGERVAT